jgi:hypothetical protein
MMLLALASITLAAASLSWSWLTTRMPAPRGARRGRR